MEESRKRAGNDCTGESAVKRSRAPVVSDGDGNDNDMLGWLSIEEETVGELMKLLEEETMSPAKVKFIDDPYSSQLIFQSSASYVTINGNEESCGSSFSDSESSVMASVDVGGINIARREGCIDAFSGWTESVLEDEVARYWAEDGEVSGGGTNGCDGFDWDDESLARFIGEDLF